NLFRPLRVVTRWKDSFSHRLLLHQRNGLTQIIHDGLELGNRVRLHQASGATSPICREAGHWRTASSLSISAMISRRSSTTASNSVTASATPGRQRSRLQL